MKHRTQRTLFPGNVPKNQLYNKCQDNQGIMVEGLA